MFGFLVLFLPFKGPYQRFERSTKGHGMPCGSEPLHLAPRRERITLIPPLKEGRALHLDPRGRGSTQKLKGAPYKCTHLGAPTTGEALLIYVAATTQVVSAAIVVAKLPFRKSSSLPETLRALTSAVICRHIIKSLSVIPVFYIHQYIIALTSLIKCKIILITNANLWKCITRCV